MLAALAEVLGDVKDQLELPGVHCLGAKQRLVSASVGVGAQRLDQLPVVALELGEVDAHAGSRFARRSVEHMG